MSEELYIIDGKMYLVNMDAFKKAMFEPMPMVTLPPPPDKIYFARDFHMPVMMDMRNYLYVDVGDLCDSPPWEFAYLFPLGRRAFKRKSK